MNAADTLAMAGSNLARRKGRTALTAAGVFIGVAALVLMVSLGLGIQRQVVGLLQGEESLRTLGVTRLSKAAPKPSFLPVAFPGAVVPLTDLDLEEVGKIPGVERVLPSFNLLLQATLRRPHGPEALGPVEVAGLPEEEASRLKIVAGRMWRTDRKECLLPSALSGRRSGAEAGPGWVGSEVAFGPLQGDDRGQEDGLYTVAGVFDSGPLGWRGERVFLAEERARDLRRATRGGLLGNFITFKEGSYPGAEVRLADPRRADEVKGRLVNLGYDVMSAQDLISQLNVIFLLFEGFLACSGAIGLVVSLFGIANTMAVAVLERVREIGIMKALGARNRDVGRVFLVEAAGIGALGGAAGLAGGLLAGLLLNAVARALFKLPDQVSLFYVSPWLAAGSLLFSISVSVAAGYLPARRAARLDPVAALRYE